MTLRLQSRYNTRNTIYSLLTTHNEQCIAAVGVGEGLLRFQLPVWRECKHREHVPISLVTQP